MPGFNVYRQGGIMPDQPTLDWLRTRALSVLAELMTSDDDRIALRAAQTVITTLDYDRCDKETRIVIHYVDRPSQPARASPRPIVNPQQPGPIPGGGLRSALGQDRSGEDSCA